MPKVIITQSDEVPSEAALFAPTDAWDDVAALGLPEDDLDDYSDEPRSAIPYPIARDRARDRYAQDLFQRPDLGALSQAVEKLSNPWRTLSLSIVAGLTVWLLRDRIFGTRTSKRR